MNTTRFFAVAAAAAIASTGCVSTDATEPSEPETITVTETPEPEVTTETVEVASEQCLAALGEAEDAFDIYSEGLFASADAMDAVSRGDTAGVERATDDLEALAPDLEDALTAYYVAAAVCRGLEE